METEPVFGALFAMLLLDEVMTMPKLAGAMLVVLDCAIGVGRSRQVGQRNSPLVLSPASA